MIRQTSVSVGGVRSLVREAGPGESTEAVVFVHGNPGSGEDWLDLLGRVGSFTRAIAPDMPGYGKADRPRSFEYTVAAYARHLGGLLDALHVQRAHLVLHDFGGPWGLTWASDHPGAVASLTLFNVGVLPGYRWHKFARIWRTPVLGELMQLLTTRRSFGMFLNADNPKPFPRAFVDRMYADLDAGTKRAILKLYRSTNDLGGLVEHVAGKLGPLHVPTLVLWGTNDAYLPVRFAEEQRRFFDVRELRRMPGCGHWPFIDDPEGAAEPVVRFLRERLAAATPAR
ncbi:MAG TPA: alpha/beta hydrolase [Polyangiaceae bacterium]|jgi:pimeloyl-ACP methyl ester carboxylesterase